MATPSDSRTGSHPLTSRAAAAVLAVFALVSFAGVFGSAARPASADPVEDLQKQARDIAERLDELQRQSGALAEQFNSSQVRSAELKTQIATTRERLTRSRADRDARRAELARYALGAYVNGGGTDDFDLVVKGKSDELGRRQGYTNIALGDRQQLIDNLQAAERAADDDLGVLQAAEKDLAAEQATILQKTQQASDLAAEQQRIQSRVQGELADAVAQQQQRIAAEAEAAARARFGAPSDAPAAANPTASVPATDSQQPGGPASSTVAPPSSVADTPTTAPTSTPTTTAPPVTTPPRTDPPPVTPPPSNGTRGQTVVAAAMSQQGVPYSWGGGSTSGPTLGFGPGAGTVGFDCSGLTLYAWAQAGVYIARVAQSQYDTILHIPMSSLQPGDLVFYGSSSRSIDHVAIYIGGGQVVHAPHTGAVVRTASLYLGGSFGWVGAGRPAA